MSKVHSLTKTLLLAVVMTNGYSLSHAAEDANPPAGIGLTERGHGWLLKDAGGMALYTYVKDPLNGAPLCTGSCLTLWQPLEAEEGVETQPDWSIVTREDGIRQWAFRGKPLYRFARDTKPGDMNGDEYLQEWNVAVKPVPLPPGFETYKTPEGYLLTDQRNMTLYTSADDQDGRPSCVGDCTNTWLPVEAWWRARSTVDGWTIADRDDGTRQWVYRGKPVYRFAGDFAPGDMAGDGVDSHTAIVLEEPPPIPDWITIQYSDAGPLLADASGRTLYTYELPEQKAFGIGIGRDMATPHLWDIVAADADSEPVGNFSVLALDDGRYQWAYKGLKLFTHKRDTERGDLNGQRSTDRYWRTIMKDGKVMPGSGR